MPVPGSELYGLLNQLPASTIVLFLVIREFLVHRRAKNNGNGSAYLKLDEQSRDFIKEITKVAADNGRELTAMRTDLNAIRDTCLRAEARLKLK